ncbi:MAG: NfeD family protein [Cyanobacteria bacterium P01_F01_bin.150]
MLLSNLLNPKSITRLPFGKRLKVNNPKANNPNDAEQSENPAKPSTITSEFFPYDGIGEVLIPITPDQSGRIHFRGTDWPAQLSPSFIEDRTTCMGKGMTVQVVGRQGITLLVAAA